jgi:hypothetical protein
LINTQLGKPAPNVIIEGFDKTHSHKVLKLIDLKTSGGIWHLRKLITIHNKKTTNIVWRNTAQRPSNRRKEKNYKYIGLTGNTKKKFGV